MNQSGKRSSEKKYPIVQFAYMLRESDYTEPFVACFRDKDTLKEFQDRPWKSGYVVRGEPVKLIDSDEIPPDGQEVYLVFNAWYVPEEDESYWESDPVGLAVALERSSAEKVLAEREPSIYDVIVQRPMGWIHPDVDRLFLDPDGAEH